jgi:hypothetical protein
MSEAVMVPVSVAKVFDNIATLESKSKRIIDEDKMANGSKVRVQSADSDRDRRSEELR